MLYQAEYAVGHPDFRLFSTFFVFCGFSELKKAIPFTSRKIWGEVDSQLFQNLVKCLNSVFSSYVMILREILFERAFNSVQVKKYLFELTQ